MAKKPVDPYIEQLITYTKINSLLRQFVDVTVISESPFDGREFIYMQTKQESAIDRFAISHIPADLFRNFLINTIELGSFNKYLKKTMTLCEQNSDRSLVFTTPGKGDDGGDAVYTLPYLEDNRQITRNYKKFFKDAAITKAALQAATSDDDQWQTIDEVSINELKENRLIHVDIGSGRLAYMTKAIFGAMRKTGQIQCCSIEDDIDTSVVLFRQREEFVDIYHIARFVF